jgi:hypothetical protein
MDGSTLSPIFGVIIILGGLALAVFLGTVLYEEKDEKKEVISRKSFETLEEIKMA